MSVKQTEDYLCFPDNDSDFDSSLFIYTKHECDTDENVAFQLGFKPHEDEYFGEGYQLTS